MKPELLETLLLDRALGELAPEVAALLDAHLAQNPAAARHAAEFAATVEFARAVTAAPTEPPRRALDRDRLRRAQHAQISTARRTEMLRLAACLALGLGAGWFARPAPAPVAPPVTLLAITPPPPTDPATNFWSVARFAPATAKLRPQKKL